MLRDIRPFAVAIVVVIGVAFLMGAQFVYHWQTVERPLQELTQKSYGIEHLELKDTKETTTIIATLHKVTDLQKTYRYLLNSTQNIFSKSQVDVEIQDSRNELLEASLTKYQLSLFEAINNRQFTALEQLAKDLKSQNQLDDVKIFVDETRVYLQLQKGNNSLYEVIRYNEISPPKGVISN